MSHKHVSNKQSGNRSSPPDIVTYRYEDEMVYVPPAPNHQEAIKFAKSLFAEKLKHVDDKQITFSINSVVHHESKSVRISPMSWPTVVSTLARYEIIDIVVHPLLEINDAPPEYPREDVEKQDDKSGLYLDPPSPNNQRSPSRSPSPNPDGNSEKTKAKNWLGKLRA